jgi:hypothetical protein
LLRGKPCVPFAENPEEQGVALRAAAHFRRDFGQSSLASGKNAVETVAQPVEIAGILEQNHRRKTKSPLCSLLSQ